MIRYEREEAEYIDIDKDGRWNDEFLYLFLLLVKLETKLSAESGKGTRNLKRKFA